MPFTISLAAFWFLCLAGCMTSDPTPPTHAELNRVDSVVCGHQGRFDGNTRAGRFLTLSTERSRFMKVALVATPGRELDAWMGSDEVVARYDAATGELVEQQQNSMLLFVEAGESVPVWIASDAERGAELSITCLDETWMEQDPATLDACGEEAVWESEPNTTRAAAGDARFPLEQWRSSEYLIGAWQPVCGTLTNAEDVDTHFLMAETVTSKQFLECDHRLLVVHLDTEGAGVVPHFTNRDGAELLYERHGDAFALLTLPEERCAEINAAPRGIFLTLKGSATAYAFSAEYASKRYRGLP